MYSSVSSTFSCVKSYFLTYGLIVYLSATSCGISLFFKAVSNIISMSISSYPKSVKSCSIYDFNSLTILPLLTTLVRVVFSFDVLRALPKNVISQYFSIIQATSLTLNPSCCFASA